MTIEEAVEQVLQGATYLLCTECAGAQFVGPARRVVIGPEPDAVIYEKDFCTACEGYAHVLDPVYASACAMTGTVLPTHPRTPNVLLGDVRRLQLQWKIEWWEDQRALLLKSLV